MGDYYLPPLLWDRLMVPMAYYFPVAIDLADHLRGLLSSSIDTASAGEDDYLLFYYQDGPGRPPQRFIILVDRYSIGRWGWLFIILLSGWAWLTTPGDYYFPPLLDRLMVPKDYHSSISIDPANYLRGLLSLLIDTASASGDDYLLFYHQDGPSRPPQGTIISLHYCRIGWWSL